jgi:hypothetical protein
MEIIFNKNNFFRNGFATLDLKDHEPVKRLDKAIQRILLDDFDEPFYFESKYPGSRDFRPSVTGYDSIFVEIASYIDIEKFLRDNFGSVFSLSHIQLRVSEPIGRAYAKWHRDTYFSRGRLTGNVPPAIKLIYYPHLSFSEEKQLKIVVGSHRLDVGSQFFDRMCLASGLLSSIAKVFNTGENWVLFDTSALHCTFPVKKNKQSPRLIYTFLRSSNEGLQP